MNYNPDIHKRKSLRLKEYDYSREGIYFITISIQSQLCLLGEIKCGNLILFDSGEMIKNEWLNLENRFKNIKLHNFVIMPNHFHGIIEIKEQGKQFVEQGKHKVYPYGLKIGI